MKRILLGMAVILAGLAAGEARAATLTHTFDIGGLDVEGGFDDNFPTLFHDFGSEGLLTEISLDISYESFDPSWMSEVAISLDTDSDFLDIYMDEFGAGDDPGIFSLVLTGEVIPPMISTDGLVVLTLWDYYNDTSINPDARFLAGSTVTVTFVTPNAVVPEPASFAMAGMGVLALGGIAARRRARADA